MGELVSPNQVGHKGNVGGGKDASAPSGSLVSPAGSTSAKEAGGHGDGRGSKDSAKNRAFMS